MTEGQRTFALQAGMFAIFLVGTLVGGPAGGVVAISAAFLGFLVGNWDANNLD